MKAAMRALPAFVVGLVSPFLYFSMVGVLVSSRVAHQLLLSGLAPSFLTTIEMLLPALVVIGFCWGEGKNTSSRRPLGPWRFWHSRRGW